jgi:hypothetical protein
MLNVANISDSGGSQLNTQNTMSSAFSSIFNTWETTQANIVAELFSGSNSSTIDTLWSLIQYGLMIDVPSNIDISSMVTASQAILYGQMIPTAWSIAPGTLTPFIL